MDLAARPYAFDDLLPEITAFAEVQGMRLVGFLRQKTLADIFAVARLAVLETAHIANVEEPQIYTDTVLEFLSGK